MFLTKKESREVDILKTKTALEEGYRVIRIDYTQIDNIKDHLLQDFNS